MKNKKVSTVQNKLKRLVDEYVKIRDKNTCQWCGRYQDKGLHVSHVIPKSRGNRLRWDVNNLKLLCMNCHKSKWHAEPTKSGEWFKNKFPNRWEYIEKHKGETVKWKVDDYEEMIENIKREIVALSQ